MDRRGWPWKKKLSDKNITEKPEAASDSVGAPLSSLASLGDQGNYKKVNYVQIPMDSYRHLSGLEEQVNILKDQVQLYVAEIKDMKGKLSAANSEINAKENLVMEHAKVAEEAVSGWEKAESEALALKHQLKSVTLLKITVEERASHLDAALRECMNQIRSVKQESEQKLQDVILTKSRHWDKIKLELEAKIAELNQGLVHAASEKAALFRSLEEQSNLIVEINEEKSRAEAEIEFLKGNIQSRGKEICALKYELHLASKELDIRNEEKNMSLKSAEIANKQHLEGVRTIAKLEGECQRLRCLVRRKLPGPAALAQMKLEVENSGREISDLMLRSTVRSPNAYLSPKPEISFDNLQQCEKETDFLTTRLLAMEKETEMLREALATCNSELQVSRNMYAEKIDELASLEAEMRALNQLGSPEKSSLRITTEDSTSKHASNFLCIGLVSADEIEEQGSSSKSWEPLNSGFCQSRVNNIAQKSDKPENASQLEILDDFLEMERLAANVADGVTFVSTNPDNSINCKEECKTSIHGNPVSEQQSGFGSSPEEEDHCSLKSSPKELEIHKGHLPLLKLKSRNSMIFESQTQKGDIAKIVGDLKCAMQEIHGSPPQISPSCVSGVAHTDDDVGSEQACSQYARESQGSQISLTQDCESGTNMENTIKKDLSFYHSCLSLLSLASEAMQLEDISNRNELSENLKDLSAFDDKFTVKKMNLVDFFLKLSHVLAEVGDTNLGVLGFEQYHRNITGPECIDKVTLLENSDLSKQTCEDEYHHGLHSCSKLEILQDRTLNPGFELDVMSCKGLLKELEHLKLWKDNMAVDLARCMQNLEKTTLQLQEKDQLLPELKLQLSSSQELHSLAETKLKCITESYKLLEVRGQELKAQVNLLQEKTEKLEIELSAEKRSHQDALAKCNYLQDKVRRSKPNLMNPSSTITYADLNANQEKQIEDAAEKLAACQETIRLLSGQLQALHSHADISKSQYSEKLRLDPSLGEGKPNHSCSKAQEIHYSHEFDQAELDNVNSSNVQLRSNESLHHCSSTSSPSDLDATLSSGSSISSTHHNDRLTKSISSSSSSTTEQDKHSRGFGRFFSLKGKISH